MADPKAGLDPNGICICMLGIPNGVGGRLHMATAGDV